LSSFYRYQSALLETSRFQSLQQYTNYPFCSSRLLTVFSWILGGWTVLSMELGMVFLLVSDLSRDWSSATLVVWLIGVGEAKPVSELLYLLSGHGLPHMNDLVRDVTGVVCSWIGGSLSRLVSRWSE
jgi:hypothetical protein